MKILIATRNQGKIREFESLLASEIGVEFLGSDSFPDMPEVDETGTSFAENARLKAVSYGRQSNLYTIADDSGLEVAALGGRPGVYSARYAGSNTMYDRKIEQLLREIDNSNSNDRSARFVAHIAFASPKGEIIFEAEGVCEGTVARSPRGAKGFGYDPIFIPHGHDQTFGELDDEIKNEISHRAHASRKIMRLLRDFA